MGIEASDHDVVLQLLKMVGESAVERRAIGCDAILRFPDGTSEFWTTNPAPLTMVRGKGSTH